MKSLKQLSQFVSQFSMTKLEGEFGDQRLNDLHLDSRQLNAGDGFIALQGANGHGLDYLQQALQAGIGCLLSDRDLTPNEQACLNQLAAAKRPCTIVIEDLSLRLAQIADWFYGQPSQKLKVVGITGTNGKTSTAHYLAQLLFQLGQRPALIGTLGNGIVRSMNDRSLSATQNTTPDAVSVHRMLHRFYQQGANWVVMEVSSHALELGRIAQVEFESVALTQVTRDHLDFHGSEQAYQQAKFKLFTDYVSSSQIVNADDEVGRKLIESGKLNNILKYSLAGSSEAQLQCQQQQLNPEGITLSINFQQQTEQACLNLMGGFNIENVLCALGVVLANGFRWQKVAALLPSLSAVEGRMQKVASRPAVIIDFAHTADALQQVLLALKQHVAQQAGGATWVVFGCGGDRDQGKRPLMAQVAEKYADRVVLTSDNPRFESPQGIIDDTLAGFDEPAVVTVIEDRKQAIEFALQQSKAGDVILVAGKGHENYQDIAGQKLPFSDKQVVLDWLQQYAN